ncbi:hypothetical protein ILUMI_09141 [Ignelater luminosus]|uniref:Uncharacterized protein n=1 Tax=Ignelater luminosus TaxID=2038154 RepID=A0A8K0D9U7_IGNLU|nr:hypothetical protein ILUMI_09141 [Ignelater luminosus]
MELKEPRAKKHRKIKVFSPLPIIEISEKAIFKFSGYFNSFTVVVKEEDQMKKLNNMGCFGKGNLSRGYPLFNTPEQDVEIIRRRVFNQRKKCLNESSTKTKSIKKVIVVPDSESENEDYFTNLKPEYQIDSSGLKEVLNLSLEEAFFLSYYVQCLDIYNSEELLSTTKAWELFKETDGYFELLICQLLWPEELNNVKVQDLAKFSINETIMRRWIPSQNRELLES